MSASTPSAASTPAKSSASTTPATSSPQRSRKPLTFDRVARIVFGLLIAAGIIYVLDLLKDVLLPFCAGCLIAYIIEPLVRWNMRWTHIKRRLVPVLLTIVEVAVVVCGLGALFMPEIARDCQSVGTLIKRYSTHGADIPGIPAWVHEIFNTNLDLESVSRFLHSQDVTHTLSSLASFLSGGLDKLGGMLSWLMAILYVFFILLNYPTLMGGIKKIVPPKYRGISEPILSDVSYTMKRYFRTQALISAIVGVIYAAGFSIIGLPLGLAIGLMNAVLFMVPYLVYVSLIPVTLLCIICSLETGVDFWVLWLKCIAVYVVAECTADLWLTPHLMGKSLNLDPAIILLGLSVWGSLLGLMGMIIALPMTTIIISYYRMYILHDPTGAIKHTKPKLL